MITDILFQGFYYWEKYIPNVSNFPSYLPGGKWMIDFIFKEKGETVAHMQWFVNIVPLIEY